MANPNWKSGISGNPKGRPKKERALANLLESVGSRKAGTKTSGDLLEFLAEMIWQGLLTGQVVMVDKNSKRTMTLTAADWKDLVKFYATHTDGPIVGPGTDDEPLQHIVRVVTHNSKK